MLLLCDSCGTASAATEAAGLRRCRVHLPPYSLRGELIPLWQHHARVRTCALASVKCRIAQYTRANLTRAPVHETPQARRMQCTLLNKLHMIKQALITISVVIAAQAAQQGRCRTLARCRTGARGGGGGVLAEKVIQRTTSIRNTGFAHISRDLRKSSVPNRRCSLYHFFSQCSTEFQLFF